MDVRFERDGQSFVAIDTAGVRKKRSLGNDIEFYSAARAERSIRRADVVLLFLDPQVRISKVDKQLAEYVLEQHKPAIFVVNKWDLMIADAHGPHGRLHPADVPEPGFRADRVHHGQGGQERPRHAEPGPEPAQAGEPARRRPAN